MGGNGKKRKSSTDVGRVVASNPQTQLQLHRFGRETEFWFLIERISARSVASAEELHNWVKKHARIQDIKIVGTTILDRASRQSDFRAKVYCEDSNSARETRTKLNRKTIGGRQIWTSCVSQIAKSSDNESKETAGENADGKDHKDDEKQLDNWRQQEDEKLLEDWRQHEDEKQLEDWRQHEDEKQLEDWRQHEDEKRLEDWHEQKNRRRLEDQRQEEDQKQLEDWKQQEDKTELECQLQQEDGRELEDQWQHKDQETLEGQWQCEDEKTLEDQWQHEDEKSLEDQLQHEDEKTLEDQWQLEDQNQLEVRRPEVVQKQERRKQHNYRHHQECHYEEGYHNDGEYFLHRESVMPFLAENRENRSQTGINEYQVVSKDESDVFSNKASLCASTDQQMTNSHLGIGSPDICHGNSKSQFRKARKRQRSTKNPRSLASDTESQATSAVFSSQINGIPKSSDATAQSKEKCIVMLNNLPASFKYKELVSLFKGKIEGFRRAFLTNQKGTAVAVFSSSEEATSCAETMKSLVVSGRKINVRAKISPDVKKGSEINQCSVFETGELKACEKVNSWLAKQQKLQHEEQEIEEDKEVDEEQEKEDEEGAVDQDDDDDNEENEERKQQPQQRRRQRRRIRRGDRLHKVRVQKQHQNEHQHVEPFDQKQMRSYINTTANDGCRAKNLEDSDQVSDEHQEVINRDDGDFDAENSAVVGAGIRTGGYPNEADSELRTVVVRNIPNGTTRSCLVQFLKSNDCRGVVSCVQPKKRHSAVLTFSTASQAKHAVEVLGGLKLKGATLKVEEGRPLVSLETRQIDDNVRIGDEGKNLTVKLYNIPSSTRKADLQEFIAEQCKDVGILSLVKARQVYIVQLGTEDDCEKVCKRLRGKTFNGVSVNTTWTKPSRTGKKHGENPYVVVDHPSKKLQEKMTKKLFVNLGCKGVIKAERGSNTPHIRVYFETLELAEGAIEAVNGCEVGGRRLKVTLGVDASREKRAKESESKFEKYIAELDNRKFALLKKNAREQEKLLHLIENKLKKFPKKQLSPYEFERREDERNICEQKHKELKEQRTEFEQKYDRLFGRLLAQVGDLRSGKRESSITKVVDQHEKLMNREFNRFEASLPIYARRREIIEFVCQSQVVVLVGETGSGKSTQLAPYLADEGFSQTGTIVVTQPRKIAAVSLAERVAKEYGCSVGEEVGYQVGLAKKISRKTIIKFVTDRILLNEVLVGSASLTHHSCIVIDEAHERSIHSDLLLATLKQYLPKHPDLRLIVTSATLNTEIFRRYFDYCPVVRVQGRGFPVERVYARVHPNDYVEAVSEKAEEICESGEEGDILIFLTQQNEIEKTCERLKKRFGASNVVLPLHGKLQPEDQNEVFKPTPKGQRKIVVATNSAETSITINGIRIVIDSGMVKEPSFDPVRNMTTLNVKMVSQSSAIQRRGRAGRTGPGKCYAMYTEEDFNNMEQDTKPEILKMHLGMAVLQLLSLGVRNVEHFDFVEAPPRETLARALESLKLLGAVDEHGALSDLGKQMVELPTDPKLSKALLEGLERGCGEEIVAMVALMASGRDVFFRGDTTEKKDACAIQKQEFCSTSGDLLSALDVYKKWSNVAQNEKSKWCMENALNAKTLRSTRETIDEIMYALKKLGMGVKCGSELDVTSDDLEIDLRKSLLAGYYENIAWSRGHEKFGYVAVLSNQAGKIHPSSVLASLGSLPHWILFQEMRRTSETFLLNVTPIEKDWLAEIAMHMLQYVDEDQIKRSQVIQKTIQPLGPSLVKCVIGFQGKNLRQIEQSVLNYTVDFPLAPWETAAARALCSIECSVENGCVNIYCPADRLEFAKSEVNEVIEKKKRDLLNRCTEVVVSNVGGLKALIGNDMRTRDILQPGESCMFDIFVTKEDERFEMDPMEVLEILKDGREIVHYSLFTAQNPGNKKWGSVTYSNPVEAENAMKLINCLRFEEGDSPYNVESIQMKPCRVEHRLQFSIPVSVTGICVLVTWYPFPSTGKAYIKCTDPGVAEELIRSFNHTSTPSLANNSKAVLQVSGDVALPIDRHDDENTVTTMIRDSGFQSEKAISNLTVPSYRGGKDVDTVVEKRNLLQLVKGYGDVQVCDVSTSNCQKVTARLIFSSLEVARNAIEKLNGAINELGARAVYLELERISEVTCSKTLYGKIEKMVKKIAGRREDVLFEVKDQGHKGIKMTVTGDDGLGVQVLGSEIADLVMTESVAVEELAACRGLCSDYGRNKLKKIQKQSGAFVQARSPGHIVQINGSPDARQQAIKLVKDLVGELLVSKNLEISLKGADRPVGAIREVLKEYGRDLSGLVDGQDCQVEMDIRRRKLVLKGSGKGLEITRAKVEAFLRNLSGTYHRDHDEGDQCPVCIDLAEQPYRLSVCGHAYCTACVSQYITSIFDAVKSAGMFPLKCLHEGCGQPLTMDDYVGFLKANQIEQLYRISFESFVVGSDKYRPCQTPDCPWVYPTTSKPKGFVCPECSARVCRGCGERPHELYDTCAAYKATKEPSRSEELYEEWVCGADTRKCPKCSVMIEKNEGCSHVKCSQCHAHICWKCGKCFPTSSRCYDHINDCRR